MGNGVESCRRTFEDVGGPLIAVVTMRTHNDVVVTVVIKITGIGNRKAKQVTRTNTVERQTGC